MTQNPGTAIETMRAGLGDPDATSARDVDPYDISEADRELLLELSNQIRLLGPSEYSDHRHEFLLRRGLKLAKEVGGLADAVEDRDAAEKLVGWINSEQTDSPETNKDYRVALRNIGKIVTDGDDIPESMDWIPGGYPKNYDPAPDPAQMLKWEDDIQPMLDACLNSRDRALVSLAWDLGPRPGELFDLTVGAVTDHQYGLQVTLDGKTGRRSPVLVPSVPYVRKWLDDHPGGDSDPLFCGLTSPDPISNNRVRDILKEVADRADVTKTVTPTNFRKSSASYLASQGVSQAHLEDHHGWKRGSSIAARYIAVFDDANEREIARAHGLDVEADEPDAVGPVICVRCEQKTPREKETCVWCGQALSQEAVEKAETQRQDAMDDIRNVDRDELADAILTVESVLGDDVSLRAEMFDD
ncbi:tyrosine-type recombinase/integrase [Halorussus sp. AFM4]|uniref:tyrosine-type recombinase/integrase n=1 Tax=Halorussus sp. AFM4 TaxID=3421651 RepID=UPI003EB7125D